MRDQRKQDDLSTILSVKAHQSPLFLHELNAIR
jgi:hypothetical protein